MKQGTNRQCKALKGTQNSNPSQWPGLILFSSTTGLLTDWVLLSLCYLL